MIVADPGLNKAGLIKPFEELLKKAGVDYFVFDHVRPNPETITIDGEAIPAYRDFKAVDTRTVRCQCPRFSVRNPSLHSGRRGNCGWQEHLRL